MPAPQRSIHEVQNAYEAYERVFRWTRIALEDFLEAHHLLTRPCEASGQVSFGDVGVYDASGRVVHVGARPQFVPSLVLFSWAKGGDLLDLVKRHAMHFWWNHSSI